VNIRFFIQIRRKLEKSSLKGAKFIEITAKGNNQNYFIHLRTSGTLLPWQYYQISFKVVNDFKIFKLPINEFKRSSVFLSKQINPENITSSIESPLRFLADDSPITHLIASIILDLPHPFGPIIPVKLLGKDREVESTNVLKPDNLILVRRIENP